MSQHEAFLFIIKYVIQFLFVMEVLNHFESLFYDMMDEYSEKAQQEHISLKKRMTETDKAIYQLKVRLALGEISSDVYAAGMQELQTRKDILSLELSQFSK